MAGTIRALSAMSPVHTGKLLHRPVFHFSIGVCFGLILFFPSLLCVLLKRLTGNKSAAKEDAIFSQRITASVAGAHAH